MDEHGQHNAEYDHQVTGDVKISPPPKKITRLQIKKKPLKVGIFFISLGLLRFYLKKKKICLREYIQGDQLNMAVISGTL